MSLDDEFAAVLARRPQRRLRRSEWSRDLEREYNHFLDDLAEERRGLRVSWPAPPVEGYDDDLDDPNRSRPLVDPYDAYDAERGIR